MSKVEFAEGVKPYKWTEKQAHQSGRTGYRIGVPSSNNPFLKYGTVLSTCWSSGWDAAAATDPYAKRVDHYEQERTNDRYPKPRGKDNRIARSRPR